MKTLGLMATAGIAVASLTLAAHTGFAVTPVLTCDSNPATGIGARAFIDGNGNPVTISSVTHKETTPTTPAYCEVRGVRWPLDLFVVALPDSWQGNFWQAGQGGFGGSLASISAGTSRGWVAASGSAGHDNSQESGLEFFQILYPPDDPAAKAKYDDFAFASVHLTKLLALDMIEAYYGDGRKPEHSYFESCSNGGRQGLIEAQRYAQDFDGLIVSSPANPWSGGVQGSVWEQQLLLTDPWAATGGSLAPKLPILAARVMQKCDSIDGLVDGLIDDPAKCDFSPVDDLPACPDDVDGATCFTRNQRDIIKKFYEGPSGLVNSPAYPRWSYSSEASWRGARVPINPPPFRAPIGGLWLKWVALPRSGRGGPGWDWQTFNWTNGDPQLAEANTADVDAVDPDLWDVKNRGGKIISWHGGADSTAGVSMSFKYYDSVVDLMGYENTQSFFKLYQIPGLGHCGGGVGAGSADWLSYLVNWVENGVEPATIVGSRNAVGGLPPRSRALCPYPQVARYRGTGSIDAAGNFMCVATEHAAVTIEGGRLSLSSGKPQFTALIDVPQQADWRATSAVAEGALATSLTRHGNRYQATFKKQDLVNISAGDNVAFTVTLFGERQGNHLGKPDAVPAVLEGTDRIVVTR